MTRLKEKMQVIVNKLGDRYGIVPTCGRYEGKMVATVEKFSVARGNPDTGCTLAAVMGFVALIDDVHRDSPFLRAVGIMPGNRLAGGKK